MIGLREWLFDGPMKTPTRSSLSYVIQRRQTRQYRTKRTCPLLYTILCFSARHHVVMRYRRRLFASRFNERTSKTSFAGSLDRRGLSANAVSGETRRFRPLSRPSRRKNSDDVVLRRNYRLINVSPSGVNSADGSDLRHRETDEWESWTTFRIVSELRPVSRRDGRIR